MEISIPQFWDHVNEVVEKVLKLLEALRLSRWEEGHEDESEDTEAKQVGASLCERHSGGLRARWGTIKECQHKVYKNDYFFGKIFFYINSTNIKSIW